MYNGKRMNLKSSAGMKRKLAVLVSLILVMSMGIGATIAYLIDDAGTVQNVFTPSEVTTSVQETRNGNAKEAVKIQNTGDTTAYIRAAVVITWQDEDGNVYSQKPGTDAYVINLPDSSKWDMNTTDGYYYYTLPVTAGASTENLYDSITAVANKAPEGYHLTVEIIGSGIQSVPTSVVAEKWGVTVNADGTISK